MPRAEAAAVTSFVTAADGELLGFDQQSDPPGGGDNLVQQSQLLYRNLGEGKVDAGRVAARPGEADDETESDRIVGDAEHDRNRGSRRFRRQGRSGASAY